MFCQAQEASGTQQIFLDNGYDYEKAQSFCRIGSSSFRSVCQSNICSFWLHLFGLRSRSRRCGLRSSSCCSRTCSRSPGGMQSKLPFRYLRSSRILRPRCCRRLQCRLQFRLPFRRSWLWFWLPFQRPWLRSLLRMRKLRMQRILPSSWMR